MGLESPIESWLAPDNRCACSFQNGLASSPICDETAGEIPSRHMLLCGRPALRGTETRASCLLTGAGCQDDVRSSERYFPQAITLSENWRLAGQVNERYGDVSTFICSVQRSASSTGKRPALDFAFYMEEFQLCPLKFEVCVDTFQRPFARINGSVLHFSLRSRLCFHADTNRV